MKTTRIFSSRILSPHVLSPHVALLGGIALLIGVASEASAQYFPRPFFHGGYYSGRVVIPAPVPRRPIGLDVADIFEDLAARGFRSLALAARRPDVIVIDAIDSRSQPVRLVVDAYDGDILERFAQPGVAARTPSLTPSPLSPDARKRDQTRSPGANAQPSDTRLAEIPAPPRRPSSVVGAPVGRPQPVAPARDPSLWAPAPTTPVAPLE